jgi:hypothetical protein
MIKKRLKRRQFKDNNSRKIRKRVLIPSTFLSAAIIAGSLALVSRNPDEFEPTQENRTRMAEFGKRPDENEDTIVRNRSQISKHPVSEEKQARQNHAHEDFVVKRADQRGLLGVLEAEFSPESITCEPRQERFPRRQNSKLLISRYSHGPHSFNAENYPLVASDILNRIDSSEKQELIRGITHLAEIGIAGFDGHGRWSPKVLHYGQLMLENRGTISFDMQCVSKSGQGYLYTTAIMVRLINMEYENQGYGIAEIARDIPDNLREPFYELLSFRLFRDDGFDPAATAEFISQMSENQKADLFNRLYEYVYINNSFRKTASEVKTIASQRGDHSTASRLGAIITKAERNDP